MATLVNYTCKSLLIDPRSESPNENTSKNLLPYFGSCTQLEKYTVNFTISRSDCKKLDQFVCQLYLEILRRRCEH